MGQTQAIKETIWLKNFLAQLYSSRSGDTAATTIFCDNQGSMALARDPQFHGRSKHMCIQLNWQREQVEKDEVELRYTPEEKQVADGMTKALCKDKFVGFRKALGVIQTKHVILSSATQRGIAGFIEDVARCRGVRS
jgi:hypothetical protein